jgi:hypothetical protein
MILSLVTEDGLKVHGRQSYIINGKFKLCWRLMYCLAEFFAFDGHRLRKRCFL